MTVDLFHFDKATTQGASWAELALGLWAYRGLHLLAFPELQKPNRGWRLNTSIAGQTIAGFVAIYREMCVDIFLDKIMMRKNKVTFATICRKGLRLGYCLDCKRARRMSVRRTPHVMHFRCDRSSTDNCRRLRSASPFVRNCHMPPPSTQATLNLGRIR